MDLHEHLAVALPGAGSAYLMSGEASAALAYVVGAVLIDVDHLVDYWRETGLNADWRVFLGYFEARKPIHSYLPLHGWEWPMLLAGVGAVAGVQPWFWALTAGLLSHLCLDHASNRLQPLAYAFCYRWSVRFDSKRLYVD